MTLWVVAKDTLTDNYNGVCAHAHKHTHVHAFSATSHCYQTINNYHVKSTCMTCVCVGVSLCEYICKLSKYVHMNSSLHADSLTRVSVCAFVYMQESKETLKCIPINDNIQMKCVGTRLSLLIPLSLLVKAPALVPHANKKADVKSTGRSLRNRC